MSRIKIDDIAGIKYEGYWVSYKRCDFEDYTKSYRIKKVYRNDTDTAWFMEYTSEYDIEKSKETLCHETRVLQTLGVTFIVSESVKALLEEIGKKPNLFQDIYRFLKTKLQICQDRKN